MSKVSLSLDECSLSEVQVAYMKILYLKCPAFLIFISPVFEFVCNWDNWKYRNGVNCGDVSQLNVVAIAAIIQAVFS